MALNGVIITFVEMVMIFKLEGKKHAMFFITGGFLLTAISFLLLNILPEAPGKAVFCMVLVTFGEMLALPFMNSFWIYRTTDHNRGEYAALYSMSWSASQVIAPFVGGYVISYGGFNLLWWVLAIQSLIAASGYLLLYKPANR